jgi:hypothetical protein
MDSRLRGNDEIKRRSVFRLRGDDFNAAKFSACAADDEFYAAHVSAYAATTIFTPLGFRLRGNDDFTPLGFRLRGNDDFYAARFPLARQRRLLRRSVSACAARTTFTPLSFSLARQ